MSVRRETPRCPRQEARVAAKDLWSLEESHFAESEKSPKLGAPTRRAARERAFERQPKSMERQQESRRRLQRRRQKWTIALERQPRSNGGVPRERSKR